MGVTLKVCEKKKRLRKNTNNIRLILKIHISIMAGRIRLKFGMGGMSYPEGVYTAK